MTLELIIFAVVAIFLALRLRDVLGRSEGKDKVEHPFDLFKDPKKEAKAPTDATQKAGAASPVQEVEEAQEIFHDDSALHEKIERIREIEPSFHPNDFLSGAEAAFEMVVEAFAGGDLSQISGFTTSQIYKDLKSAVDEREASGESLETTLVGFKSVEISDISLDKQTAEISVLYVSDQVNIIRDAEGQALEGGDAQVATQSDRWTLVRKLGSRDPNWTLAAIESLD